MSNRRIFTEEFKAGAVQLVVSSGRSIKDVATELGIQEATLGAWVSLENLNTPMLVWMNQALLSERNTRLCRLRMLR
ncbi:hypothetical protein N24_2411 [Corynebacterium suranareeae]|uniref:Transposase n=1 Tax=Corynebacterium suranareeae TaxID=2506452 RepID=A0A160PTQ6_9CORY|nr:transposase [Corynebacterium suranareeae]BAU96673.1 hypothetical protein N24_2411 [Corynebacterium suranareeae]